MKRYPIEATLDDETLLTIRPLEKGDKLMLADFFQRIPEEDRFYLKENVTASQVIHDWVEHMDLERVVPLVAVLREHVKDLYGSLQDLVILEMPLKNGARGNL